MRRLLVVCMAAAALVALAALMALMHQAEAQTTTGGRILIWQQKCPLDASGVVTIEYDRRKHANIVSCSILE